MEKNFVHILFNVSFFVYELIKTAFTKLHVNSRSYSHIHTYYLQKNNINFKTIVCTF